MISVILWLPVTVSGHTFDIFRNENNVYSRAVLHNDTDNVKVIPIHISPTQCTVFFLSVSDSPFHATLPPYPASFQKPWVCRVNRSRTWVVDPHTHSAKCFFCCSFYYHGWIFLLSNPNPYYIPFNAVLGRPFYFGFLRGCLCERLAQMLLVYLAQQPLRRAVEVG